MASDAASTTKQPAGVVTVPRGIVRISGSMTSTGTVVPGWLDFEVENNALSSADTFSVRFIGSGLPKAMDVSWFSQQKDMYIELFAGFPANYGAYTPEELTRLIYGQADTIDYDIAQDVITVHGRDLTRVFIDAKTTEKFQNQTSSQIATTLAKRRGLTPNVTATKTKAGAYYDIEHVNLMDERTEWDILSFLAQQEGFNVYVKDQTLYFGPPRSGAPTDTTALQKQLDEVNAAWNAELDKEMKFLKLGDDELKSATAAQKFGDDVTAQQNLLQAKAFNDQAAAIGDAATAKYKAKQAALKKQISDAKNDGKYPVVWTRVNPSTAQYVAMAGNVEDMQFQRTLTVSRGVTVIVRSWNDKNQYGFNATYPPKKVGSLQPGQATTAGGGQVFTFFYPNIDKQRALQIAQQKYDLIVAHEMKFSCRLPGDVTLNAQTVIQVSGTGTAFDQTYYPSQIVRRMSFDGGFEMNVHGKNHAATSQAVPL
jgi:hypothetical protein